MSFRFKIDGKSRFAIRFMSRLQALLQNELIKSGMTQQQVAEKLDVNRSVVNRRLSSDANLTARSLAEFAFAFDKELEIKFVEKIKGNYSAPLSETLPRTNMNGKGFGESLSQASQSSSNANLLNTEKRIIARAEL